ncbi:MAG TPA: histidine kinase [Saprospiraceae bacterium]|nr:histidine kinase [Saprospiraceae bacterium]
MSLRSLCRLIRVGILLGLAAPLYAQSSQSLTYSISDGMPMTEVSTVYCDKEGRIWSVYNNSMLSCFDGRRFITYTPEVTGHYFSGGKFLEDRNGMWLIHHGKSISLFTDGIWIAFREHAFTGAVVDKATHQVVTVDTTGNLYTYEASIESWNVVARVPESTPKTGLTYLLQSSLNEDRYLLTIEDDASQRVSGCFSTLSLLTPEWRATPEMQDALIFWKEGSLILQPVENWVYLKTRFEDDPGFDFDFAYRLKDEIILYTATSYPGSGWLIQLFQYTPLTGIHSLCTFSHGHASLSITRDHQGHVWIGSQGGLTCVFPEISTFHEHDLNMVSGVHVLNEDDMGRVWIGGYSLGLCYYSSERLYKPSSDAEKFQHFLPGAYRDEKGNMGFWTEDYAIVTYSEGRWYHGPQISSVSHRQLGYYFLPLSGSRIAAGLMGVGMGIAPLPLTPEIQWKIVGKSKNLLLDNVITVSEDRNGRLWAGRASQGVALYDPDLDTARTWMRHEDTQRGFGAACSLIDSRGQLWLGCNDGLRYVPEPHNFDMFDKDLFAVAQRISMDEAGYSDVTLMKEHRGFLVFGNRYGYGFLNLASQTRDPLHPNIFFYPTDNFLKSADQNTILIDSKGDVWIGQDLGVTRIDFDHFKFDSLPVYIIIDSVLVSGENLDAAGHDARGFSFVERRKVASPQRLPVLKRHLEIYVRPSFTGLLNDNVGFQYRLRHENIQDTTWSAYSKRDRIVFSYLPPGNHHIDVRAIKNNQVADTFTLNYQVPLSLSENPLFWVCLIGGLSILGAIVSWRIYRQQLSIKQTRLALKEKELALSLQEREKEQLQIKAIANALNPHFINNSLQWLQSRVRKDPDAVRMIDRFSKNIHTVFVNSRQGKAYHALGDELELVKNYLYIQKSRYGDFVDVTMPPDELIASLSDMQIPLMQIQIHVENAIEHGLRHRPGARKLNIYIQENSAYVHIDITDDGIGRLKSAEIGSHGTQQGTDMLKSLHAIFNKHNALHILSRYIDTPFSYPETGEKYGTVVHIEIPKHYTYELTED